MEFGGLRNPVTDGDSILDLFADGIRGKVIAKGEEAVRDGFVLANQAEQYMFGRNYRRSVLKRFIASEKNNPARCW